jgi:Serine dehydrogenase proteinase
MADKAAKLQQEFFSLIRELERKRKSRIFCLIQDFENEHLCSPQMRAVIRDRNKFSNLDTLEILVHTPGGHASIAYRMARFFKSHCRRLNMIVPLTAKSAGTILCLAGDCIYMGELAELGPLDVQITDELEKGKRPFSPLDEFKSMDFLREYATEFLDYFVFALKERGMSVKQALHEAIPAVTGMMSPMYAHIDPSKVGSYRRSLAEGEEYARRLLQGTGNPNAEDVVERLVWKYPEHDFVIDPAEAIEIGLPVKILDYGQEQKILSAMMGMVNYGMPFCGFVPDSPKASKVGGSAVSKKQGKRIARKKLPASAQGNGSRQAVAV